jgi:hypothetical protein
MNCVHCLMILRACQFFPENEVWENEQVKQVFWTLFVAVAMLVLTRVADAAARGNAATGREGNEPLSSGESEPLCVA